MKLQAMVGYKLFKELEDGTIDLIRITKVPKSGFSEPTEIYIKNEGTGETKKVKVESLKDYTPLEPDGIMTFNIVSILNQATKEEIKDVVVTASKILNIKIGDTLPYAVCRQNITDIFYNLLVKTEEDMLVGLSINRDNCPGNFDYGLMLACDSIDYTDSINFYRTDILDDILSMVKVSKFDTVLETLFIRHMKFVNDPAIQFRKEDKGWCKNLKTLLKENNFQEDVNQMLGITGIETVIDKYTVKKTLPNDEEYTSLDPDFSDWLCSIFKINIADITVIEYNHDINLAEFNNARYLLLRDGSNKLYLAVYTLAGEYHESDLEARLKKKDFSTEFRINFYNKYNNIK